MSARSEAVALAVLRPDALRWIVSGDERAAWSAVQANHLGTLRAVSLRR